MERVLIVHNRYQYRGGEDAVVEAESELLTRHGHVVERFEKSNDGIGQQNVVGLAAGAFWSNEVAHTFGETIRQFRPDIIHVHNVFPLISPAIYWTAARLKVPVVQTLHNYRLLCPQALFLRNGKICEDCLGNIPWRGVTRRCYRGSLAQSAVLAGSISLHRGLGTWDKTVARYIALNRFSLEKFVSGGIPRSRLALKPNFVDMVAPQEVSRSGFLFVGRLSPEKGCSVLEGAASELKGAIQIRIAGEGPDRERLQSSSAFRMLGFLDKNEVARRMSESVAVIFPSVWYEPFGMVILEAMATATPVIASRIGGIPELVEDGETGLLFEPGNVGDLAQKMRWAESHPEEMRQMGKRARQRFEHEFTADRNYEQLTAIYREASQASSLS